MQNSNINFDDFFRARLGNQETAVAPDMFDRIMRERKRRKPLFWWSLSNTQKLLLGGVLLTSISLLGWKYLSPQKIDELSTLTSTQNAASNRANLPQPHTTKTPFIVDKKDEKTDNALNTYLQKDNTTVKSKEIRFHTPPSVTAFVERQGAEVATPEATKPTENTLFATQNLRNKGIEPSLTEQGTTENLEKKSIQNNFQYNIEPYAQKADNQSKASGLTLENLEKIENLTFLHTKKLSPLAQLPFQTPNDIQGVLDEGCKSFNKKKKKLPKASSWFFDAYLSPDYAMRRLQNISGDFQNYIQARDTTESQWYAFSAGARISRVFKTGIALRGGVHYAQINEIFDYKQHDFTRITRTTVEIRDVSGALLRVDTVQTVEIGLRQRTDYNRYRSIDLPMQIGYEWSNKSITWSGNLGLNLNLYSWQSGKLLNTNLEPTEVENSQVFRTQVGLSAFASIGCYININRKWQWLIEPNIRYQIGSWTRNNYPLRQDYTTLGLFTGVRYRFEKKKRFFF